MAELNLRAEESWKTVYKMKVFCNGSPEVKYFLEIGHIWFLKFEGFMLISKM
jgi:hypothetical protein